MKVYLAAGFSRKDDIAEKSKELEGLGLTVTSTWPWEDASANCKLHEFGNDYHVSVAGKDLDEIRKADALILFTHDPTVPFCRGGRMHEAGFAHGSGKSLIVCGPRENIFHYLPEVTVYDTWEQLKAALTKFEDGNERPHKNFYFPQGCCGSQEIPR